MKRLVIASLVGAIILYVYLSLAHVLLPIHKDEFKYTAQQDNIMQAMNAAGLEEGYYFLPNVPPGSSMKDEMESMQKNLGKPYATLNYHTAMVENYSAFFMGFIYNLISVLILCIAMATAIDKLVNFRQRLWFVMLFAFFVIFSQLMLEYNWWGTPMSYLSMYIFDQILGYLLVGIWLAWYYGRLAAKAA